MKLVWVVLIHVREEYLEKNKGSSMKIIYILIAFFCLLNFSIPSSTVGNLSMFDKYKIHYPWLTKEYFSIAKKESLAAKISVDEVLAIIQAESEGNRKAISHCGARGLMQIMAKYHYPKGNPKDLYCAKLNIKLGVAYYKYCKNLAKGNKVRALISYNAGPGCSTYKYKNWGYVYKILKHYKITRGFNC